MDFSTVVLNTKIWNTTWGNKAYLQVEAIDAPQDMQAKWLQLQAGQPGLAVPTKELFLYTVSTSGVARTAWLTGQAALLDPNWTLTDPTITADTITTTTESTPEVKATSATVSF
jgi:hypothetical protein